MLQHLFAVGREKCFAIAQHGNDFNFAIAEQPVQRREFVLTTQIGETFGTNETRVFHAFELLNDVRSNRLMPRWKHRVVERKSRRKVAVSAHAQQRKFDVRIPAHRAAVDAHVETGRELVAMHGRPPLERCCARLVDTNMQDHLGRHRAETYRNVTTTHAWGAQYHHSAVASRATLRKYGSRPFVRLTVVIPVGPNCKPEFVSDTLDSIDYYCVEDRHVVLVDDSHRGTAMFAAKGRPNITVINTPTVRGTHGGLFVSLSEGFETALAQSCDVVLRMDTDAIITGSDWEATAIAMFEAQPRLGSLGHWKVTPDGKPRDHSYAANRIRERLSVKGLAKSRDLPRWRKTRLLVQQAQRNGYELGDAVMGGIAVYRPGALRDLQQAGLLSAPSLARLGVEEDYAFGLALGARGWKLGEFGSDADELPMYARHVGLGAHPSEILAKRKALVHSTKSFEELEEAEIRTLFRAARSGGIE